MRDAKHTPGPWEYRLEGSRWVLYASGQPLALAGRTHRAIANRARIAAAPDLLEALKALTEHYVEMINSGDCGFWNPEDEEPVKVAHAAIAKAEGRS